MTARKQASGTSRGWQVLAAGLALAAAAIVGCGKDVEYGPVYGRVTFNGQPLSEGQVVFFEPQIHVYHTAKIRPDGEFVAKMADGPGLIVGTYQVAVMPPVVEGPGTQAIGPSAPREYPNIPAKYRDPKTSGLTVTIEEGANPPFDINMK